MDKKGALFRTAVGQIHALTEKPMAQVDVYRMIRRRAEDAGIETGDRVPHVSGDGHHRVPHEWRHARRCAADGCARVGADNGAL
jgi:integrase